LLTVLDFSFENAFTGATSHQGFGGNLPNAPISTTCFDMKLLDGTGDLASPDFQDTSPGGQLQKEPLRKYYTQQYRKQICENMGCTFIGFEGTEKFNFNTKIDLSNDACKGLPKRCPDSASYKFVGKEANTARSLLCSQAKCNYKDGGNIFPTNDRCGEPPAYCYNQNDDDGDGFTDCEDHDCDLSINCAKEICDDGKDNNVNSKIDCDDQACYDSNLCDSFCDSCNDDCIKVSEKYQCVECESDSTCENSPAYGSGYVCNKNKCEKDTSQAICGGCNDDCAEKDGKWSCVDCATDSYCQDSGQYGNTFQCTNNKCVEKLIYAHYKFEENGKNSVTLDDFVDVKFVGEKFVSGVNAKSLQLAGTTSSSGLFDVDLLHGRKDFSVSIWMKPEKLDVGVLSGAKKDNDNEFGIYLNGDKRIWVGFEGSQKYMKNPGLELNKWSQIILTRSGKIVALYFNGKKVDTLAVKENALNIDRFYLGQEIDLKVNGQPKSGQKGIDGTPYSIDPNQAFKGKLDELKFFSKALTGLEASTIYNQEKLKVNLDTGDTCKSDDECKKGLACDFSNNNICLGGEGYDCSYQSSGKDGFCATGLKCIAEGNSYVCKGDFEICDNKIDDNKDGKADCLDY